ncbi:MAG: Rieske 2Fe-2S domain-containing protein [Candidatus Dormibacteraeota bacterium]|nr:Rieske 2Fe-2S domain-containing protein [Candidatus Dormibacteraeota bacterium]
MSRDGNLVNRWVDALLGDRSPKRVRGHEQDADLLRAAIELRASSAGAGMPDQRFVDELHRRIRVETQGDMPPSRAVTRRGLLVGGGLAVAAAAVGVVGDRLAGDGEATPAPAPEAQLVPDRGRWIAVAAVDAVPAGTAVRFSTAAMEGLVVNRGGIIEALSANCTHQGCIVTFNHAAGRLDCPCHETSFGLDGSVLFSGYRLALPPLPRVPSRVRDGNVEVLAV